MRCRCGADLVQPNARGVPMLRNHGLVLKAEGLAAICPRCKADVPVSRDAARALVLILQRPVAPARR